MTGWRAAAPSEDGWLDGDATRLVRLYEVTGGRTRPTRDLDLISMVVATGSGGGHDLGPDHERALSLCGRPVSVAEVSARLKLPATTTKVLLADLADCGTLRAAGPLPDAAGNRALLRKVLSGLQQL